MADEVIARAEAQAQGLKRFFTAVPCRQSHVAERYVKDGKCTRCVALLASVRSKRWYALNPEKVRASTAKWRVANPDKLKESSRQSKATHQKRYNEEQKRDYARDPTKYRESWKRYYEKNRDRMVLRAALNERKRKAQKRGSGGTHTAADLREILAQQGNRCAYCRTSFRTAKKHVDHIKPLAKGGSNDKSNLQYLCAPCNLSKGAKDPVQYAQEIGLLL